MIRSITLILFSILSSVLMASPNDYLVSIASGGTDPAAGYITQFRGIYFVVTSPHILDGENVSIKNLRGEEVPWESMFLAKDRGVLIIRLGYDSDAQIPIAHTTQSMPEPNTNISILSLERLNVNTIPNSINSVKDQEITLKNARFTALPGSPLIDQNGVVLGLLAQHASPSQFAEFRQFVTNKSYESTSGASKTKELHVFRLDNINDWSSASFGVPSDKVRISANRRTKHTNCS